MQVVLSRNTAIGSNLVADINRTGIDLSTRAGAELVLLSVIRGGIFFSVAIALRETGPVTVALRRVGWAAALLWLAVAVGGPGAPRAPCSRGAFPAMGVLDNATAFTLTSRVQILIGTG